MSKLVYRCLVTPIQPHRQEFIRGPFPNKVSLNLPSNFNLIWRKKLININAIIFAPSSGINSELMNSEDSHTYLCLNDVAKQILRDQVSSLDAVAQELQDFQSGNSLYLFHDFRYQSVLLYNLIFSRQRLVVRRVHDYSLSNYII